MKKLIVLLAFVLFSAMSYAQWATSGTNIYNTNTGNVGVGTSTPATLFDVSKSMTEPTIQVKNLGGGGGATYRMTSVASAADWKFKATSAGGFKIRDEASLTDVLTIEKAVSGGTLNAFYIKSNGNIGIGVTNPTVKLAVNGKVNCKEVEVTLTGWPDYVFNSDYNLLSLGEVESYISANNHLPGVPSQSEVLKNGNNLGQMDAVLLQKIEELTLYMIDLKKQNDQLKHRISQLEK